MKTRWLLIDEGGSVLILGMLMLVVLSLLGIAATRTSTVEIQIAANERTYQEEFYVAESGWKEAVAFLNNRSAPPSPVNAAGNIVKNYGIGGEVSGSASNLEALNFPDGTQDQVLSVLHGGGAHSVTIDIPYWYQTEFTGKETNFPGAGPNDQRCYYNVISDANRVQDVTVTLRKDFLNVGY